jgi:O-antigen/teichoic acid export membrane protein
MSRARNFVHAVWSGYAMTAIVSLLNLVTIPFACAAIGKPAWGLWCAVTQLAAFTNIFDVGFGPSLGRFITDYKDDPQSPAYASFLKSVFLVGVSQGTLFSAAVVCLIPYLPWLMGIPAGDVQQFKVLFLLQAVTTALNFPLRPLTQLLWANQQIARMNGCSIAAAVVNAGVLLLGLHVGWGIYSFIAAGWASFAVNQACLLFCVVKLRLLPSLRHATVSIRALKPLAGYSANVFLIILGTQLIAFAPGLLITRKLGLSALADWTVGTRLVSFANQLIGRIPNSSEPVFWEMFTRGELPRLRQRLIELLLLSGSGAALFAAGAAAINVPFVTLWMAGKVQWMTTIDIWLVMWVVVSINSVVFNMVPGTTKRLGNMKYVYALEGSIMAGLAYLPFFRVRAYWQVVLVVLVFVSLFRLPYGLWRTWRDLRIPWSVLAKALARTFGVTVLLLGLALVLRTATSHWRPVIQLSVNSLVFVVVALPAVYFISLPLEPRQRVQQALRRIFA